MTRSNHFVDTLTTKVKKIWHKKPESITELRKKKIMTHGDGFEVRGKKLNTLYQLILDVIEKTEVQRTKSMILLMENIEKFIKEYKPSEEGYIYRKDIWNSVKNTLHVYIAKNGEKPLVDYGRHIRQRISFAGRGFRKVVGTTLLTKGLEYEHVIIDTSGILDAKHLYVALSRAKKEITVFGVDKKIRLERPLNI